MKRRQMLSLPGRQRGLVLLIALIVLVAMTLAGIGMMRSIDTSTLIAGNLAFKQSTTQAADRGTSDGYNALMVVAVANRVALDNAGAFAGYAPVPLAPCEVTNTCAGNELQWWNAAANWAAAPAVAVNDANGATIATVSYLVHRMCTATGPTAATTCQTATGISAPGKSQKHNAPSLTTNSVFYRITARAVGPRGTVSVTQTQVLLRD